MYAFDYGRHNNGMHPTRNSATLILNGKPPIEKEMETAMLRRFNLRGNFAVLRTAASVFALAALALGMPRATAEVTVAAEFRGEWVPAKAACTSPLRLKIDAQMVTFVRGTDRAEYRKLDQCFSCAGRDVENVTLLTTDAMGDSPFTIYLDGSKKKLSVQVYFDNDKKLAARFPFGKALLKKCK
ncbi:MAG TPA: hypothetical protein VF634_07685 [Pyrinomonadaceae bacterium]|jgi:hypothetical protein